MSIERRCYECDYVEDIRLNFGNETLAENVFHGNFTCPECGVKRTYTPGDKDL